MNATPSLALRLLGGFALEREGRPIEPAYGKGRALLAYLVAEPGRAHARTALAGMFWPDLERSAGLANLRLVLHDLRQSLDRDPAVTPTIQADRESVRFVLPPDAVVDTAVFGAALPACLAAPSPDRCGECLGRMTALIGHYRGEFMAGFELPDCPDFDEWLQSRRDALQLRALGLLTRLADCLESLGEDERALSHALSLLDLEPWSEESLRRAMRLLAQGGRPDDALARYEAFRRLQKRDFDAAPMAATRELADRIRRGEFAPSPHPLPAPPCPEQLPAERRQITVLRCELDGDEGDPDAFLERRQAPLARGEEIVRAHGGQPLRDRAGGLLGYFGYPRASADAAPQALRAAQALAGMPGERPLRVGVHSGIGLCGGESAAIDRGGAVTSVAGHLCQIAPAGGVAVSETVHRGAAGRFAFTPIAGHPAYRLGPPTGARDRCAALATAGCPPAPWLDRRAELAVLAAGWRQLGDGAGRCILLRGPAGIGKSRLAAEFAAGLPPGERLVIHCDEAMRAPPPPPAGIQPRLLVIEDLQRAAADFIDALGRHLAAGAAAPQLVLLLTRPGGEPPWADTLTQLLEIGGLDDLSIAELVATIAPACSAADAARICARAEGNPLFATELALAPLGEALPAPLRDLLAERYAALGPALRFAQAAAAIGREFSASLLARVVDCGTPDLARLAGAELIEQCAGDTWRFRQVLMREAIYDSLPRVARTTLHGKIAAALQTARPLVPAERQAPHWAAAGDLPQAIACWLAAGRNGVGPAAVRHYQTALELVERLPVGHERTRMELELQIGLGAAACAAEGYASATGAAAYARARVLGTSREDGANLFPALWGLWASASSRGGFPHALELARQLRNMADASGDPLQDQQAEFALGNIHFWLGEFVAARRHLEDALAGYRPAQHAAHVAAFGEDVGVTAGAYLGWTLWYLGLPEQALQASAASLALARRHGHPMSLAYSLSFAAILHCRLRQPDKAQVLAREVLGLAASHGFTLWRVAATAARGWAQVMRQRPAGIDSMVQSVEAMHAAMGGVVLAVLEPLAQAQVALGRHAAARDACANARKVGAALGDRHADAELLRLEGEALLGLGEPAAADACFRDALATARRQDARALELRAAASRMRARPAEAEARQDLAAVLAACDEGHDSLDYREARRLLQTGG